MRSIPIKIHPFFWIFAFLIGWLNSENFSESIIWLFIILVSVLIHEFGHAFSALAFGQKVRIELVAFGGLTFRHGKKLRPWQDFIVVLCGPLAGFLLYLISGAVLNHASIQNPALLYGLEITVAVNLIWTLLNLIPVIPLDGGKLFSIVLEGIFGFKGFKAALIISVVLGFGLSVTAFIFHQLFLGILFSMLAYESYRSMKYVHVMIDKDRDESLQKLMETAQQKKIEGDEETALQIYEEVREKTQKGILYSSASELAAQILFEKAQADPNAVQKAYQILSDLPNKSPESVLLWHKLAYQVGNYREVIKIGNEAYQLSPSIEIAMINAISNGALSQVQPAVGWLECAVREGMPNPILFLEKKEFDPIREHKLFKDFKNSLCHLDQL